MREFKPEQIKRYLAKEVIGRLPNASAIDLAHFGGLNAAPGGDGGRRRTKRTASCWRSSAAPSRARAARRIR